MDDGDTLPDVTVTLADGTPLALTDLPLPVVIYFYPKDDTSGCTREAQDFSALSDQFAAASTSILGISKDDPASHVKFAKKHELSVTLASDEDGSACQAFGAWIEKSMYGRKYMGIERSTFLFGTDGTLQQAWRKVRVAGHAEAALDAVRGL
ncbi:MAG: peroxiredoxin [Pseudomonadota bacterium]|nr:peroxiredoxin [Pseudomonadota bacterium]